MTTAIDYASESEILETGDSTVLAVDSRRTHEKFVKITEADGSIRLVPFSLLSEAEQAILLDPDLYAQTRRGLDEFVKGDSISSDWLFEDE